MANRLFCSTPAQLVYYDSAAGKYIPLPMWVSNPTDLAAVEASIRNGRWGNIKSWEFYLKIWSSFGQNAPYNTENPGYFGPLMNIESGDGISGGLLVQPLMRPVSFSGTSF